MKEKYMNRLIKLSIVLLFISLFYCQPVSGQGFDPISMGMGGAYGAVARGINAVGWNPANLALPRTSWLEINIIGVNLNVANSSLTIDNYERYFTESGHNGEWSDEEIEEILALVPDEGLDANVDLYGNALGVAFGNYAVTVQVVGLAHGIIPKAPLELILRGNTKESYSFDEVDANGFSSLKITLSGAYPIKIKRYFDTFAVGANLSYYSGFGYADVTEASGGLYTGLEYIHSDILISGRLAESGTGLGLDVGAAGVINKKLTVSMSFNNLLGSINWSKGTQQYFTSFLLDSTEYKDDFTIEPVDTSYTDDIDAFSTRLPVVLHMGAAYEINKNITVALDLEQAFSQSMGYSDQAKLSVGAEYRPTPIVPLRAGFSFGGKWGWAMGLGVGFHMKALQFDFAYTMHRALLPAVSKGMSFGLGIKIAI